MGWRCNPHSDKGQEGFSENRRRHSKGECHQDHAHRIRQNVAEDDVARARAKQSRRLNVALLSNLQHLPPD